MSSFIAKKLDTIARFSRSVSRTKSEICRIFRTRSRGRCGQNGRGDLALRGLLEWKGGAVISLAVTRQSVLSFDGRLLTVVSHAICRNMAGGFFPDPKMSSRLAMMAGQGRGMGLGRAM